MARHCLPSGTRAAGTTWPTRIFLALQVTKGRGGFVWTQDVAPALASDAFQLGSGGILVHGYAAAIVPEPEPPRFQHHVDSHACANPHPSVESLKASVDEVWVSMTIDDVARIIGLRI